MLGAMGKAGLFVILLAGTLTLTTVGITVEGRQDGTLSVANVDRDLAPAVVVDNIDPAQTGRVKVQVPALPGEPSVWARLVIPTGKQSGFLFIPDVGDEVLVGFEQGDINRPFVIGAIWNGKF